MREPHYPGRGLAHRVALDRNLTAVALAIFLMGLGEELWKRFIPKYLEALGAPIAAIGVFGTARDFLDGAYQYPGGWFADRFGRRVALLAFVALAAVGYGVYLAAPAWPFVFVGLVFAMAWSSMASPTLFAAIGDALPRERRVLGFTVQAIVRRIPMMIAPTLGGWWIASRGVLAGFRLSVAATLGLALVAIAVVGTVRLHAVKSVEPLGIRRVWRCIRPSLRILLASDILIRACEGLADVFIVLYVTTILGLPAWRFGLLVGVQMATSIGSYFITAALGERTGRKPFVVATFACFALFPVAVVLSRGFPSLLVAFVIGGLREIGEPSRKAMIVDAAEPTLRARTVGIYYLVRSVAIAPASTIGGWLWHVAPITPFIAAGAVGLVGTMVFALTRDEQHSG
jgi:MFS family permease